MLLILGFFITVFHIPAQAREWRIDETRSTAEFRAIGRPGILKVHGEGAKPTGVLTENDGRWSGAVKVSVAQFATGISMRDEHLKQRYLEVDKFPEALLEVKDLSISENAVTTPARLTLHGKTKEISLTIKGRVEGQVFQANGSFMVKISDFEIPNPGYKSVTMAESVDIEANIRATAVGEAKTK